MFTCARSFFTLLRNSLKLKRNFADFMKLSCECFLTFSYGKVFSFKDKNSGWNGIKMNTCRRIELLRALIARVIPERSHSVNL